MGGGGLADRRTAFGYEENGQLIYTSFHESDVSANPSSSYAIAIGDESGGNKGNGFEGDQGPKAISIGFQAGRLNQKPGAISVGAEAGKEFQHDGAISIGLCAGELIQNQHAVAVGAFLKE